MTLRRQVLRGGAYLAVRHGLGTAINVAGILLLTRFIGPVQYGVFAAALGFFTVLHLTTRGVGVFLVRREGDLPKDVADQATTLLLLIGVGAAVIGLATLPLVHAWSRLQGLMRFSVALYAALPLAAVAQVPLSQLERSLEYRNLAYVELAAQILFFATALPLAYLGYGAWAAVIGWWVHHCTAYALYYRLAKYRPRWLWNRGLVREVMAYGAGYTASLCVIALRRLVNPLFVGRYLGAEAVAIVAVTTQIVSQLGFVAAAAWRLYPAALGRVQSDSARLVRAITDGMRLQILSVGPFLLLFAWISGFVVPRALGPSWTPIVVLFPYVATAHLVIATFHLHASALHVLQHNIEALVYNMVNVALLAVVAILLIPSARLVGYGIAEISSVIAVVLLHLYVVRRIGSPSYARAAALLVGFAVLLFWPQLGVWSLAGFALVLPGLYPWRQVTDLVQALRGAVSEESV